METWATSATVRARELFLREKGVHLYGHDGMVLHAAEGRYLLDYLALFATSPKKDASGYT